MEKEVYLGDGYSSTKKSIEEVFGDYIDDAENLSYEQFGDCINYAQEKGWDRWERNFREWRKEGKIPFYEM